MRLVNARTLRFEDFDREGLPPYAILSHTWEAEEVTFQDMAQPYLPRKRGYKKITETCRLALDNSIEYAWVDTCCIDKSSSAELTESINSMFEWYREAAVCYVFLADLHPSIGFQDGIGRCKWITRGWTLQELIAPLTLHFYDQAWKFRGTKATFGSELSGATGIPVDLLLMHKKVYQYSVAQRMSWAAQRSTTRIEDAAYCLLGIFEVNMPLIYGEGLMAFGRLQEEIVKRSNDTTIFAWNATPSQKQDDHCSLLASSPAEYAGCGKVVPWEIYNYNPEFVLTNKGLRIEDYLYEVPSSSPIHYNAGKDYVLPVGLFAYDETLLLCIHLRKIGPALFLRQSRNMSRLSHKERAFLPAASTSTFYTMTSAVIPDHGTLSKFREHGVRICIPGKIHSTIPRILWDSTDLLFYPNSPNIVRAVHFGLTLHGEEVLFVVLINHIRESCRACIFPAMNYPEQEAYLFRHRDANRALRWTDLNIDFPGILNMDNITEVEVGVRFWTVAVTLSREEVMAFGEKVSMTLLNIECKQQPS
ncbi:HET-domain-containing protein [Thozetella sp. PMI_491]|nr:HET-domain-containing protein [Thozetella sp. PMI_491]